MRTRTEHAAAGFDRGKSVSTGVTSQGAERVNNWEHATSPEYPQIGTLMFAAAAKMDLVRLAIPRRVYTQSHIDYVVEIILSAWEKREQIRGLKLSHEAPFLRRFTAKLEPEAAEVAVSRR